jgi:hypothetical protein
MDSRESILKEVRSVQAAQGISFDEAWNIVESRKKALPGDLGAAALAVQAENPGMSFEQAWEQVESEALPYLRKGETVGQALIRARNAKEDAKSLERLPTTKRQEARKSHVEAEDHVEAIEWQPGKKLLIRGSEAVFVD